MTTEPGKPEGRSVWTAVMMTVLAVLIAKACVGAMVEKPRKPHGAYTGGR